ncbi:MAG: sulfurtransferase TusA family protein [Proteobacteria bacterium]|mgnify:FL=1|jgi:TusA-related sulfurtransferase|nr:sulfurtransferase TusA family protein [Pseudomonadota bacterium]
MEYYLDTKGYECPIPVLKTAKRIKKLKKNDFITVESDDPLSQYDFKNYCEENNFKIISIKNQKNIVIIKFQI